MSVLTDFQAWQTQALKDYEYINALITTPRDSNPQALWEQLDGLIQWLARSGELHAEAENYYTTAFAAAVLSTAKDCADMPISAVKDIARGTCAEMLLTYRKLERQNAALVHAIDGVRSLLSYQKQLHAQTGQ